MRGTRLARGLAAVTAAAVPFALGTGSAGAAEDYSSNHIVDHTFTAGDGRQVTCRVSYESRLFRESSDTPFSAEASIFSFGISEPKPACTDGRALVSVSYLDSAGLRTRGGSIGGGGGTRWSDENVAGDFSATHSVQYSNCQAACEVSFITRPK